MPTRTYVPGLVALLMLAIAAAPGGQKGEAFNAKRVFHELRYEIDRVGVHADALATIDKDIYVLLPRMTKQVSQLEEMNRVDAMPTDYLAALNTNVDVFRVVNVLKPTKSDVRYLRDICEDLQLKVSAGDPKIKGGRPHLIKVTVNTVDAVGKPVQGLNVMYIQKGVHTLIGMKKIELKAMPKFSKRSTPTVQNLPPGNWVMWTENGKDKGPEQFISVECHNGKREMEVDVTCHSKER